MSTFPSYVSRGIADGKPAFTNSTYRPMDCTALRATKKALEKWILQKVVAHILPLRSNCFFLVSKLCLSSFLTF